MNRKVNIAVIGTGRIGSMHVANIVRSIPEANLSAICDIRLDVAQAVADEFGIERVVKDYHDLLADKEIEAYFNFLQHQHPYFHHERYRCSR